MELCGKRGKSVVSLALASLLFSGCAGAPEGDAVPLTADLAVTREHLIVKNGDASVWKDVTMTVDGVYTFQTDIVPRGSSSYPLADFADADGRPFDPGFTHLKRVRIDAADAGEGRRGTFSW